MNLTLEESVEYRDEVLEFEGVKFLLHANAIPYFQKHQIDYVEIAGKGNFRLTKI
ncbi:hypothetical protein [Ammoniphilus oxalaticus]|uniref:hypothetical protein n=1 Tax=Ammoniphilus oxalaticus TaxID=66863 RepID=UPI0014730C40|nr:hypothetical protein [Ammoniphilus oxalaticus]